METDETPVAPAGPDPGRWVYMVRCADGSLYTGTAVDVTARIEQHNAGRGARYTAGRRPVHLVYRERQATIGDALRRELRIKKLNRRRKEALIRTGSASIPDDPD